MLNTKIRYTQLWKDRQRRNRNKKIIKDCKPHTLFNKRRSKLCFKLLQNYKTRIKIIITPYIRMLDSDWLIAVIFFYKFRPCIVNLQNFYFM